MGWGADTGLGRGGYTIYSILYYTRPDPVYILAHIGLACYIVVAMPARNLAYLLLNVLLPCLCPACHRSLAAPGLCGDCWGKLKLIDPPACGQCGRGFAFMAKGIDRCDRCQAFAHDFDQTAAALAYNAMSKRLILGLKYGDRHDVIPILSRMMLRRGKQLVAAADFVIPLPLHWRRYFGRGFNQSAELARAVVTLAGDGRGKYRPDLLIRPKATESQGHKMRKARIANMRGAFRVRDKNRELRGASVLLVDDVMTTGATLSSAALCLKRAGVRHVAGLVAARVG